MFRRERKRMIDKRPLDLYVQCFYYAAKKQLQ